LSNKSKVVFHQRNVFNVEVVFQFEKYFQTKYSLSFIFKKNEVVFHLQKRGGRLPFTKRGGCLAQLGFYSLGKA
jgi:hypothetical protein